MPTSRQDTRRGAFRPVNSLSSQPSPFFSHRKPAPTPSSHTPIASTPPEKSPALPELSYTGPRGPLPPRLSLGVQSQDSPGSSLNIGDSSSLFDENDYDPRLSPPSPPDTVARRRLDRESPSNATQLPEFADRAVPKGHIDPDTQHTPSAKMVNEREPPRTLGQTRPPQFHSGVVQANNDTPDHLPKFGEASPLRNPLKRDNYSNLFVNHKPGATRPEFHKTNTKGFLPNQRQEPDVVEIPKPTAPAARTIQATPRPIYSSVRPVGGFQPINEYQKPAPIDLSGGKKTSAIDLTASDDDFDPDAAIRDDRFGAADPFAFVDVNQANENIKALLEGAFDDEDDKPKTRLRRRKKQQKEQESKLSSLADKLKALDVKAEEETKEPEPEEEEEEDDGSVDGLSVKLLPHQVDGVSWMMDKEVGQRKKNGVLPKGGILADDMGLGKTIQSLALILQNPRPSAEESSSDDKTAKDTKKKIPSTVCKSTLVVAPLALIKQWESEVKTKVLPSHKLKVLVHHGPSRTKRGDELKKYDIVVTTYQILASEHAASSDGPDGPKIGCYGVHWYRIMLDEAHTIKNRNAKMTQASYALRSHYRWCLTGTPMQNNLDELQSLIKFLRIKPYNELSRWKNDIAGPMKNGRGNLAMRRLQVFLKAFMKRRTKDVLKQEGALNPGGKPSKDGEKSEGFKIVDRKVETVIADFDDDERRFYDRLADRAQSRLRELMGGEKADYIGALVLLLRLRQACNHPELVGGNVGKDKDAISGAGTAPAGLQTPRKSKAEESKEMDDLADLFGGINVATKQCDVCQIGLSASEVSAGAVRCADCESDLAAQKKKHKKKKHRSEEKKQKPEKVEESEEEEDDDDESPRKPAKLMRKKRVVIDSDDEDEEGEWLVPEDQRNVQDLGKAGGTDDENAEGGGDWLRSDDSETGDEEEDKTPARKKVINLVSSDAEQQESDKSASESESDPEEEDEEQEDSDASTDYSSHEDGRLVPSTKIRRLLDILDKETPEHKVIVFSQFTSMLDLIEPFLRKDGYRFTRYDGSMRNDMREASLQKLRNDPGTRVLLCSLKCGSLGLNLTAASRVVILEPFWNPFVEEQAIDRVHRLNQTVDVVVYKLTVRKTVEERILDLQEAKRKLANAAIEGGKAINKLSMKDIMNLFRRDAEHQHPVDTHDMEFGSSFKGVLGRGGIARAADAVGSYAQEGMAEETTRDGKEWSRSRPGWERKGGSGRQEHAVYGRR